MYNERLRVFIAVDIEDPLVLSVLERIKDALVSTRVPMKPVETQNIHLTLRFIGEVPRAKVNEIIEEVLKPIQEEKFKIRLHGLGAFPSLARPRVVWVGVSDGAERLVKIRNAVEDRLRKLGFPPDKPKFVPHITLARIKGSRNLPSLTKILVDYSDYDIGEIVVDSIRLKKSTLTRSGPIYETLWEVKLH
ncbi:MAG: RNA 2',3'-cyclic phosphodiesterase [Desulfurococcales archaeon]|nr:RNA 2',3'-cyclic phosphodiesterase [Desulfurococcales archaeon]MCE4622258.1 RNA 2',3'-cyclic phosphodiesterase [Desulfurococcales archaeon]MCE4626917.1 RNA 2',3'-cyclic phosphodiesterase [Desulfurococcales archaeon]MCE4629070.1 RNA 2',3'-cyclic phosphodiesterase [Desulfurococcales archaeon]